MNKREVWLDRYGKFSLDIIYYLYWFVALLVKIFYLQFTTKLNIKPFIQKLNIYMLFSASGLLLILFSLILLIAYRYRKSGLFIVNMLLSILFLADTLYFRYYYNPINLALFYQIGFIDDVSTSITSLFKIKDIVYFIDIPVHIALVVIIRRMKNNDFQKKYRFAVSAGLILSGLLIFNGVYKQANVAMHQYDRNYIAKDLSVLYYHYNDIKTFISEEITKNMPLNNEQKTAIDEFYKEKEINSKKQKEYKGIGKNRNLIIVQIEALQQFVIGNTIEGKEITPVMNKLIEDSFYFSNYYHQVAGGNTSDAEFMTNTSLYPASTGAAYFRFPNNTFYSLPKKLKELGYNTYAFHGYKASFWNRTSMYRTLGFDTYMSGDQYKQDDVVGMGVSDDSFYRQNLDAIDTKNPFYGFMVTLSSHHPYYAFRKEQFNVGKYEGTQLGDFLKASKYVDWTVGRFIKDLKKRGLYDNSIIVFYGDHSALFEDQAKYLTDYLNINYNVFEWKRIQKIPCIIHVPGVEGKQISITGGELDLLPTLANIMDIDMPYTMGKDLLNTDKGYVVFRDSSLITDEIMYKNDTIYNIKTGEIIEDKSKYQDEIKKLQGQLKVSDILLGKNYFKKIKP